MNTAQKFAEVAICSALLVGTLTAAVRPPNDGAHLISETKPRYPASLINYGCRGFAMLLFSIDEDGRVLRPVVLLTTHPDFAAPSIRTALDWKFEPALKNGLPVRSGWNQVIWFDIRGLGSGDYSFGIKNLPSRKSPPEYKYDVPADVYTVVNPVYPYDLAVAGVTGDAKVEFVVGEDGRAHQTKVVSATRPEFGEALRAMAEACSIHPAQKNGRPVRSLAVRQQKFSDGANFLTFTRETQQLIKELKSPSPAIHGLADLDDKLAPLFQPAPAYPAAFETNGIPGSAEVEFFVDRTGQAQLPRVVQTTAPEFGWAAVTAVQQWFFAVPKKAGQPVFVRVRVPMAFSPLARIFHTGIRGAGIGHGTGRFGAARALATTDRSLTGR
jgi:TonB family protein